MGANTKKNREEMLSKTVFSMGVHKVGDTNIGLVDMMQSRAQLREGRSSMAEKMSRSEIGCRMARREYQVIKALSVGFQIGVWGPHCASQPCHGLASRFTIRELDVLLH